MSKLNKAVSPTNRSKRISAQYLQHNNIRLIKGGEEYFQLLERIIQEAVHIIYLQFYILDEDETGQRIINALLAAARRNVKIYVLVDGYASQKISRTLIEKFESAGIHFRMFQPLFKSKGFYFGRRLHHKVVVVDTERYLVGGLNISNRYNDMGGTTAWLDWALYGEGDVAPVLEKICIKRHRTFLKRRERKRKENPVEYVIPVATIQGRDCAVRVRVNDWVRAKRQIYNSYLEMFRTASSHLIIMSPYFLPGLEFRRKMKAARKRNVKIQVVLAGISDIPFSKDAERYLYRWLLKQGIEIYEYQKTVLHGKMAVCDGNWLTVGSYNVNDLSAHASVELNLDVDNKHFAHDVELRLRKIIAEDCIQITQEDYTRKMNIFRRIHQRMAYNFFRTALFLFTFYFRQQE